MQLIHEPVRGIPAARNAGFDKARGDIIARTDADTLVADDWASTIRDHFAAHPDTAALTGLCTYHDSPVGFFLEFGQRLLLRLGKVGGQVANMYGPDMALRRTAWQQIRRDVQTRADITEDLDLALCLMTHGLRIHQLPPCAPGRRRAAGVPRRTTTGSSTASGCVPSNTTACVSHRTST
ncbi:glycosyltransferase [Nocardia africana]